MHTEYLNNVGGNQVRDMRCNSKDFRGKNGNGIYYTTGK